MRTALAIALLMAAAAGWAAEPNAVDAQKETAAAAAPTKAADQPATNQTTAATATEDERPFKPPGSYKAKRVNGELLYCTKVRIYNSRFTQEECLSEAQLRDLERMKAATRTEMDRLGRACSKPGCQR